MPTKHEFWRTALGFVICPSWSCDVIVSVALGIASIGKSPRALKAFNFPDSQEDIAAHFIGRGTQQGCPA